MRKFHCCRSFLFEEAYTKQLGSVCFSKVLPSFSEFESLSTEEKHFKVRYKVFLSQQEDGFRCICIGMIHDPEVAPVAFIVTFTIQMLKIPYQ
jgi:hypothetical protein